MWRCIAFISCLMGIAKAQQIDVSPQTLYRSESFAEVVLRVAELETPYAFHFSGEGILVVGHRQILGEEDGRAKYLLSLTIDEDATTGLRDLWIEDAFDLKVIRGAVMLRKAPNPVQTASYAVRVDAVTRASPSYVRPGEQVNLWLVGRGFEPGSQVSFDREGFGPAQINGQALPSTVYLQAEGRNNELDGLQYFLQVGGPDQVQPGPLSVTVTNPDGSSATGVGIIDVLMPGQSRPPPNPNQQIDAITGASPRAIFLGQNVSMWIWGEGIASGAQVEFLSPATNAPIPTITAYSPPEVVENSTSHPGYSGIRNFLMVDPSTPEGPVNVRITNPNGSSQVANQLFSIVTSTDGANGPSGMTNNSVVGECPPQDIPLQSITSVKPTAVNQGETFELEITGIGFACGAVVAIEPGGFLELSPPLLLPGQPGTPSILKVRYKVDDSASVGPRTVSVVNPNNVSKVVPNAFEVNGVARLVARPGCGHVSEQSIFPPLWVLLCVTVLAMNSRRRMSA